MLQLDGFDNLVKDPAIYPKFNQAVAAAREGADAARRRSSCWSSRSATTASCSRPTRLSSIVRWLPCTTCRTCRRRTGRPTAFDASSERSGILTQVSFLSLFAHPGTSSPTRRGIKIHEIFMCEPTPDPPADVDFSKVKDSTQGTVRGRLLDHMENTGCTACHRRSDPPGLALEHFDGLGQLRTLENGMPIDVSADLNGAKFTGATGLAHYLRDDPRVPACLVRNVYAYGVGRKTDERDEDYLADQTQAFVASGYRVPDLMTQIATTPEFFKVVVPAGARTAPTATVAQSQDCRSSSMSLAFRPSLGTAKACSAALPSTSGCRCSTCSSTATAPRFADGAKLPVRFGTYFWGLGLTDTPTGGTRWVPQDRRPGLRDHAGAAMRSSASRTRSRCSPGSARSRTAARISFTGAATPRSCRASRRRRPRASTVRRSTRASPMRSAARRASRCSTSTRRCRAAR